MWSTACRKRIHGFIDSTAAYIYIQYRMSSSFYFEFGLTTIALEILNHQRYYQERIFLELLNRRHSFRIGIFSVILFISYLKFIKNSA